MAQSWDPYATMALPTRLFLLLYRTHATLVRKLEEHLQDLDLTIGRLCLLVALRRAGGPMLPSELGDDLAVTRANVSGLLNALEAPGLVERRPHPQDRRRTLVHLTTAGAAKLDRAWPRYEQAIGATLAPLTAEEHAVLLALLRRLS
jgi:DNA-binding MarR family transcriptional regulator